MTPSRPYLLRALYDWMLDNKVVPYLMVNAEYPGVNVPKQYVQEGRIVLDISPSAVRNLEIQNEYVCFDARFNGIAMQVDVPMGGVLGIFVQGEGHGMVFTDDDLYRNHPRDPNGPPSSPTGDGRPHLKVVK